MSASLQPMEYYLFLECGESIMAKGQTENPKHFGVFFLIFQKGLKNLNTEFHLLGFV